MKRALGILIVCLAMLFTAVSTAESKRQHVERWYQESWCGIHDGQTEVVMDDGTRCDCLTKTNAVEFDFACKWAEAIGQALHYSLKTHRRGGIVLILESSGDQRHLDKVKTLIRALDLPIDVWSMSAEDDVIE